MTMQRLCCNDNTENLRRNLYDLNFYFRLSSQAAVINKLNDARFLRIVWIHVNHGIHHIFASIENTTFYFFG